MAAGLHHVELWVPDIERTERSWGWLLEQLTWQPFQSWPGGRSWRLGDVYLVFEASPAMTGGRHDRMAPGLNHLALHAASKAEVDRIQSEAVEHGWTVLFGDRYPYAGGDDYYASYLTDSDGYEAEIVATP